MSASTRRSQQAQEYRRLYKLARWRNIRKAQRRAFPWCERCLKQGKITAATVCHHVDPKSKEDPSTFFVGPFASLCAPCHDSIEQQVERIGYSTEVGTDGWPVDSRHPANRF